MSKIEGNQNTTEEISTAPVDDSVVSEKETRQIVTPYAFHVSSVLFGTPLATPLKRGVAIGIDSLLIALLTQASSFILAGFAAATFFKAGNRLKQKKRFNGIRIALRFLTAILLFGCIWGGVDETEYFQKDQEIGTSQNINGFAEIGITGKYTFKVKNIPEQIKNKNCKDQQDCWLQIEDELTDDLVNVEVSINEATSIIDILFEMNDTAFETSELKTLKAKFIQTYKDKAQLVPIKSGYVKKIVPTDDVKNKANSIVDWFLGILNDLGLGFGWAAFYFSVFTAWWKGQTPGKKLVGIKVLKLDNSELNLWESFGRYGGYGAGLATGLLGFLQIYWDPNRQAIQDKISETLVIDTRKNKKEFPLN